MINNRTNRNPVLTLALEILPGIRKQYAFDEEEYRADCERDYREGHIPHYCRHGVNMWVDYDCACGRCESGYDPNAMQTALELAHDAIDECEKMSTAFGPAIQYMYGNGKSTEGRQLVQMCCEPMVTLRKRYSRK